MASKKRGEIQLQTIINSQTLWDEMLLNKGLTVIDVYQAWCGPCKAMQSLFRKLKNELNEDEILHFAVAEVDSIVTLQSFKDKCEPVFLFSLNGKIISMIKGANAPLVNAKVTQLINEERKVLAGEIVRPEYEEIIFVESDTEDTEDEHKENPEEEYSFVIIRPNSMISTKAREIKEKITEAGFVIAAEDMRILPEGDVRDFYSLMADEPDFEDFVSFMTSGISYLLAFSQGNKKQEVFEEPESEPESLPQESPEDDSDVKDVNKSLEMKTLQDYVDRQHLSQFCDVEEDITNANKFIDIFFPDLKRMKLEKIMALIRPDLCKENKEDVLEVIENEGYKILMQRQIVLSEEEAQKFCKEYENENYFQDLLENMTSGPSLALVLVRENGLKHWKHILGPNSVEEAKEYIPECLCARFAKGTLPVNQIYGSNSLEEAKEEIQHFFPTESTFGLIKPHVFYEDKDAILRLIKEHGFEVTYLKEVVLTQELADRIYISIKTKDFYKDVLEMLFEGPSVIMVLTRWNAIAEWRRLMGPTDPEEARLLAPESIRAHFGISILHNAVHGASNSYSAGETIREICGELDHENLEEN
ncbi:PREDICTED: thioredoxin domain-containing protein 3 [Elephantulus edwardii]|uniref:thioredoxin domain-containing protein 3 n=1 Tax=Elephantulus edwardii TaxID=28737 RepID=UPI0003F0C1A0|nr:PREDICTED: thioredoxin domain-containing protein 3 [Elephantulus edwardii]